MSVDSLPHLAALEQRADRLETPCGDGVMVWRAWGAPQAGAADPPLVLLHGGSGSWTHWARNIDALVDAGRRVWVPDLPGFGDSARPPSGGDADAIAPVVEDGLERLFGATACELVGFSLGALVTSLVVAANPARACRIVLVGAPALGIARPTGLLLRSWAHLAPGPAQDAVVRANLAALMFARPAAIDDFVIAVQRHNVERDRMRRRRLARTDAILRRLPAIQVPLHGIWGELDALYVGGLHRLEPTLREAPGFASLQVIEGAGHWVQFEAAERFDAALALALASPG